MTTMIHRRDLLMGLGICSRTLARWADKEKRPPPHEGMTGKPGEPGETTAS